MARQVQPPVLVSIVSYNSQHWLEGCLNAVQRQTVPVRIKLFDNASQDGSLDIADRFPVRLQRSEVNLGFSAAHNRNLIDEDFEYALVLNPDCWIEPGYIEHLIQTLEKVTKAGMAGGKLWRMDQQGRRLEENGCPLLDSAGIYFTPAQQHLDRGSDQADRGQFDLPQRVFGVTAAAALYSRAMLEDVRFEDEYFDEDFFAYREDAELCWRARQLGWEAIYEPSARALHHRRVLPRRRRQLPAGLNRHSLKNRYLMRMKNMDASVRWRCFPHMWLRDAAILAYVLLRERSSLAAYRDAWRLRHRFRLKRKALLNRRNPNPQIATWFSFRPQALPL
jgi:GT2 family glycosyltransferase